MHIITLCLFLLGFSSQITAQQCDGDFTTCCPAHDGKQITISSKEYSIRCDKEIRISTPASQAATPKVCADICKAKANCVNSYWTRKICFTYEILPPTSPTFPSVVLLPVVPDLQTEQKLAAAKGLLITECQKNTTAAVIAAETKKDGTCNERVKTAGELKDVQFDKRAIETAAQAENLCLGRIKVAVAIAKKEPPNTSPYVSCGQPQALTRGGHSYKLWSDCQWRGPFFELTKKIGYTLDSCTDACLKMDKCESASWDNTEGRCHLRPSVAELSRVFAKGGLALGSWYFSTVEQVTGGKHWTIHK